MFARFEIGSLSLDDRGHTRVGSSRPGAAAALVKRLGFMMKMVGQNALNGRLTESLLLDKCRADRMYGVGQRNGRELSCAGAKGAVESSRKFFAILRGR